MAPNAPALSEQVRGVLLGYVSSITAESVLKNALRRVGCSQADLDREGISVSVVEELDRGLAFFLGDDDARRQSRAKLDALTDLKPKARESDVVTVVITDEMGVVDARTSARTVARDLGFDRAHQAKIATSVSELARNIFAYVGSGRVELTVLGAPRRGIRIVATDAGPGIPNLDQILDGQYRSRTGMGLGILACKRLMDEFQITTDSRGTTITLVKYVP